MINRRLLVLGLLCLVPFEPAQATGTRLLRQPTLSASHVAFAYGSDLWIVDRGGGEARRLTSTPAVESDPHFSPDGQLIAFSSNRAGVAAVYVVPVAGGNSAAIDLVSGRGSCARLDAGRWPDRVCLEA